MLGAVEHRAKPGTDRDTMKKIAYVTKDYPNGVWSLPPFLQSGDADKYNAIGESDRMTLRFRKPA